MMLNIILRKLPSPHGEFSIMPLFHLVVSLTLQYILYISQVPVTLWNPVPDCIGHE